MNTFKRAWLSITRRKGKSILFLIVVFILGNFMAASFSIQQATSNVEKNIKLQLGAKASIELDYELINKEAEIAGENFSYDFEPLPKEVVEQVAALPEVKYYDYVGYLGLASDKYKMVQPDDGFVGSGQNGYTDFNITGITYPEISDVMEGKIEMTSGRVFTKEEVDNGSYVIVISEAFADLNGLSVGDKMLMSNVIYDWSQNGAGEVIDKQDSNFEVIGIFKPLVREVSENADENEKWQETWRQNELDNRMYTTNTVVEQENIFSSTAYYKLNEEMYMEEGLTLEDYLKNSSNRNSPIFTLNNPEELQTFVDQVKPLLPQYYTVTTSADAYENIAGPLVTLEKLATMVLWGAMFVSVLVLGLVTVLFLRDRRHELGIYLALGDKKGKVFSQIIMEVVMISFVGLTLSLFTGNLLASSLSDAFIANSQGDIMYYGGMDTDVTQSEVMDEYKVELTPGYIALFYTIGLGVSVASTIIPVIYITRLKPKEIMM